MLAEILIYYIRTDSELQKRCCQNIVNYENNYIKIMDWIMVIWWLKIGTVTVGIIAKISSGYRHRDLI